MNIHYSPCYTASLISKCISDLYYTDIYQWLVSENNVRNIIKLGIIIALSSPQSMSVIAILSLSKGAIGVVKTGIFGQGLTLTEVIPCCDTVRNNTFLDWSKMKAFVDDKIIQI